MTGGDLAFRTLDVFTDERFKGNPLAVVLDAGALETATMQRVAGEFNLSETVFVTAIDHALARAFVRIFTPKAEVPFAGHPTVGTAILLAREGLGERVADGIRLVLEMPAGPVEVEVAGADGWPVRASFRAPGLAVIEDPLDPVLVAPAFGVEPADLAGIAPRAAGHGLRFLYVELGSLDALGRARSVALPEALLGAGLDNGAYLFTRATGDGTIRARMFAPLHGIREDPATGSAAAGLAALLATIEPQAGETSSWRVVQGVEMGRRSIIDIAADGDQRITVSGAAVAVSAGHLFT